MAKLQLREILVWANSLVEQTEESVIAKKTVRNHLQANKVNLPSYKIGYFGYPRKLVISCNSAYGRYKTFLEEKAKEDEKTVEKESCSRKS